MAPTPGISLVGFEQIENRTCVVFPLALLAGPIPIPGSSPFWNIFPEVLRGLKIRVLARQLLRLIPNQ